MNKEKNIAQDLLDIQAIQINTEHYFTWTSGLKSPIYCDNRLTMSYPSIRRKIVRLFIETIDQLAEQPHIVVGCATAGIPYAAWLAEELNLPMAYVRASKKEHGKGNQIEGVVKKGQKAIVIEDLISTGGSSLNVVKALQDEGVEVISVHAIFTYGLKKSIEQFNEKNLPVYSLTNFDQLIDVLLSSQQINEDESKELISWRNKL